MAYHKLLIHTWCDWDPSESDLEEIGRHVALGEEAICTLRETVVALFRLTAVPWPAKKFPAVFRFDPVFFSNLI